MNSSIFKAYDVRGLYPEELDPPAALAIGRAVARFIGRGPIAVGRDMRESGKALRRELLTGLRAEGCDVIDIGVVATPMVYFAATHLGAAGGVMITASHNPGAYNGFKLCREQAIPIGIESGLREIRDIALALVDSPAPDAVGGYRDEAIREAYYQSLLDLFPSRPRLRVVIDAGNGIAGDAVAGLLDRLPLQVQRLYFEPDGSFPNHEADPLKLENLEDLRREVTSTGADLGIAFDGDGDRAVFVDETGAPVPADLTTALFARAVLGKSLFGARAGSPLVYDLRSSRVVREVIEQAGGSPVRWRVGHAFMKHHMRETGASFGGELSGHYYFPFPAGYVGDDGAAAMMLMLEVLAGSDQPLSTLWRGLERYSQSGEVNRRVDDVDATLERIRQAFPEGKADDLDGLTVEYPDWWFNVRPSNTEPLLRLNVEAATEQEMVAHRDRILSVIGA